MRLPSGASANEDDSPIGRGSSKRRTGTGAGAGFEIQATTPAVAATAIVPRAYASARTGERRVRSAFWPVRPSAVATSPRASAMRASPISRNRSRGSRSRQRSSRRRSASGVEAGTASKFGASLRTAAITSLTVSPPKSGLPVSISCSTTPNAQMSDRLSAVRPFACSGLM
jgi:hypothetical protein